MDTGAPQQNQAGEFYLRLLDAQKNFPAAEPLCLKVVSFTPGFSPVLLARKQEKTISMVFAAFAIKTVKTVLCNVALSHRAEARWE